MTVSKVHQYRLLKQLFDHCHKILSKQTSLSMTHNLERNLDLIFTWREPTSIYSTIWVYMKWKRTRSFDTGSWCCHFAVSTRFGARRPVRPLAVTYYIFKNIISINDPWEELTSVNFAFNTFMQRVWTWSLQTSSCSFFCTKTTGFWAQRPVCPFIIALTINCLEKSIIS